jgi:hypothetical protein
MENIEHQVSDGHIHPILLSTFYETKLLIDPKSSTATKLLGTYSHHRYIQTFLTPQWTYRAALIILERQRAGEEPNAAAIDAYGMALVLLDRAALRWKGAASMSESLRSYVQKGATIT